MPQIYKFLPIPTNEIALFYAFNRWFRRLQISWGDFVSSCSCFSLMVSFMSLGINMKLKNMKFNCCLTLFVDSILIFIVYRYAKIEIIPEPTKLNDKTLSKNDKFNIL